MLNKLTRIKGNKLPGKRVGRGYGSGRGGHTTGRGQKGRKARGSIRLGFEGGRTPLYRRIPHLRGKGNRPAAEKPEIVNLGDLGDFKAGAEITPQVLVERDIIKGKSAAGVKILGMGQVEKKLVVKGCQVSATAREKIEAVGGRVGE